MSADETLVSTAGSAADRDAEFAEFFATAWPRMFRTAFAVSGDAGAAEDATQNAFAKAYASWHRVRAADHPEAYVRRMVVNEVLGLRRRGWWRRERTQDDSTLDALAIGSLEGDAVDRAALWEAVQTLAPRQRAVIVLRYYEDLSESEIAAVLGCRPGTVKSQAAAALATLRRLTAESDQEDLS